MTILAFTIAVLYVLYLKSKINLTISLDNQAIVKEIEEERKKCFTDAPKWVDESK